MSTATQSTLIRKFDVLILGAGAAGLMCAIEAGKRGRRVAILEHALTASVRKSSSPAAASCNFTNLDCRPENFLLREPALRQIRTGSLYLSGFHLPDRKAPHPLSRKDPRSAFLRPIGGRRHPHARSGMPRAAAVQTWWPLKMQNPRSNPYHRIRSARGSRKQFRAPALVVATGGLSIPKIGATSFGYDLARQFGMKIQQTKPALVPLLLNQKDRKQYCDLAGVSAEVVASSSRQSFREKMLITHRGLSGPAILQVSSYWNHGEPIRIDLAPGRSATEPIHEAKVRNATAARAALQTFLPQRFAARWLDAHAPASWTNQALDALERQAHEWTLTPAGTEGYEKAEVTSGGVDTDELSSKTMESRKVLGLFFIGEVVDVTGQLGGYNFQWAWSSGASAGRAV